MVNHLKNKIITNQDFEIIYISSPEDHLLQPSLKKRFYFLNDALVEKHRLSDFVLAMRQEKGAYYFNQKKQMHYDCFEVFFGMKRIFFSAPIEIKWEFVSFENFQFLTMPFLSRSCRNTGLYGDFLSQSEELKKRAMALESHFLESNTIKRI